MSRGPGPRICGPKYRGPRMLKDRLEVVANIVNNEASVLTISQKLVCEIRLLKFSTYPNCQSVVMASNN